MLMLIFCCWAGLVALKLPLILGSGYYISLSDKSDDFG